MQSTETGLLRTAASTASSVASEVSETARQAGELRRAAISLVEQNVRDNPWSAIGVAASVGYLFCLMTRR